VADLPRLRMNLLQATTCDPLKGWWAGPGGALPGFMLPIFQSMLHTVAGAP